MVLWRVRAEVDEKPGRLAALAAGLAAHDGNILGLSVQPGPGGTIDEFLIDVPSEVKGALLVKALTSAGGRDVVAVRAIMRDLVDRSTRALILAARVQASVEELPAVLAELLRADECEWVDDEREAVVEDGRLENGGLVLLLAGPGGCPIRLRRRDIPFTVTEVARAMAMIRLAEGAPARWDTRSGAVAPSRQGADAVIRYVLRPHKAAGRLLAWLWARQPHAGSRQETAGSAAPDRRERGDHVPGPM
jgi:hypothetical protein